MIGHRGAAAFAPENTLPSFEHALDVGVDAVELDVHCTADDHVVVIHDPTLERTTDGTGRVEERTLADLRAFDAGYRFTTDGGETHPYRGKGVSISTLDEIVEAVGDLPVVVEIKSARAGEAMGAWLQRSPHRDRILVGGFDRAHVAPAAAHARWRCMDQQDLTGYVLSGKVGLNTLFRPRGAAAAMVPEKRSVIRVVSPGFVRRAHSDGIGVFVWTVNHPDDMRRLLDWGVDGILSDAPGRVRRVIDERSVGAEPPAATHAPAEATA